MKSDKKFILMAMPFLILLCLWMLGCWDKNSPEPAEVEKQNLSNQPNQSQSKVQDAVIYSRATAATAPAIKVEVNKSERSSSGTPVSVQEKTYTKSYLSESENTRSDTEKNLLRIKNFIKETEKQNYSLKEKVDQLNGTLESREKELLKLNEDNAALKEDLSKSAEEQNKTKTDLDARILQAEQDKNSLQVELTKVKTELESYKAQGDSLNKTILELKRDLDIKENQRLSVSAELQKLEESYRAMESDSNALKIAKSVNENQVSQLSLRIEELGRANGNMKDSVVQLTELLAKKEVEVNDKKNDLLAVNEDLNRATRKKESTILISESKDRTVSALSKKLKKLESKITQFNKEIISAKECQFEAIQEAENLKSANASLRQRLLDITIELELLRAERYLRNR
ncbi:MAG: hypothetical protein NTW64_02815 [Candidatus Omnitrophica bacterium]|nr:hypothetical protein [Candidatus Omnitrophota bacterium]